MQSNLSVGGSSKSTISAALGVDNERTFHVSSTGDTSGVDLDIIGRFTHLPGLRWGYVTKIGSGTMRVTEASDVGRITVSEGKLLLENAGAESTFPNGGLVTHTEVDYRVLSGTRTFNPVVAGSGAVTKTGSGTLTLANVNTYSGDTTIEEGTLVLAHNAQLKFVVTDAPASNRVTGTGTAIFNGDFNIDTTAVAGTTGYIWSLVDRANLTGESFDDATFSVVGFSDSENDGVWTMTDSRGNWSFDESTGELTLDVGNDYDDWASLYGLAPGSESEDADNDGLTNQEEYAFGLVPNSGASVNPIVVPLDKTTGTFRYTRRATPASTGLNYTVWTSEDLSTWTEDSGASLNQVVAGSAGDVETVEATLSGSLPLTQARLFIQVRAD